jgi:hypothetical protein
MEHIISELTKYGLSGIVIALLVYDTWYLQRKLIEIINNNTKALQNMSDLLAKCQEKCWKN